MPNGANFPTPFAPHDSTAETGRLATPFRVVSSFGTDNEEEVLHLLGGHADSVVDYLDVESLVGNNATSPRGEEVAHWGTNRNVAGVGVIGVGDELSYNGGHLVVEFHAQLVDR